MSTIDWSGVIKASLAAKVRCNKYYIRRHVRRDVCSAPIVHCPSIGAANCKACSIPDCHLRIVEAD